MSSPIVGILVLGYARPHLLQMVLESLARQESLPNIHVWIDGTADRMEFTQLPQACADVAARFSVAEIRTHHGHLGIEKLMLDGLTAMIANYDRLVILEDDCFPTKHAIKQFEQSLNEVEHRPEVFSVYGHPFLTHSEGETITRFQGWGWATTRSKLSPILARARELFSLTEKDYLDFTRQQLTPEILARLDVTPGRNVHLVLQRFYSWDSCTALLTALSKQVHKRTAERAVFNCGLGGNSGHFPDQEIFRLPPFNMIRPEEAWQHF